MGRVIPVLFTIHEVCFIILLINHDSQFVLIVNIRLTVNTVTRSTVAGLQCLVLPIDICCYLQYIAAKTLTDWVYL